MKHAQLELVNKFLAEEGHLDIVLKVNRISHLLLRIVRILIKSVERVTIYIVVSIMPVKRIHVDLQMKENIVSTIILRVSIQQSSTIQQVTSRDMMGWSLENFFILDVVQKMLILLATR